MMHISIGGFRFSFSTENILLHKLGPGHWLYPNYLLDPEGDGIDEKVEVIITSEKRPDISSFRKIFDSGFSWKCFKDGRNYIVEQPHPKNDEFLITSVFQPDKKTIYVHCSEAYIQMLSEKEVYHPFSYPLDQVAMSFVLADTKGGIIHSAGWLHDGEVFVFPGKSGAGKSTVSQLIRNVTGEPLFSDDRMIIRQKKEKYFAYGTPWAGDENEALNLSAPLKGLFFLRQSQENAVNRLSPREAFKRLMAVMTVPWYDEDRVAKMMDFSDALLGNVPAYEFSFKNESSAVEKLLEFSAER